MAERDIIMIRPDELRRLTVIRKAIDKEITQREAASTIGRSDRQVRRIVQAVRDEGDRGVVHKLRGCVSNRRICDKVKQRVLRVYKKKYLGFGPTLATEKLAEREKIHIDKETLRKWLMEKGLWLKRRKRRRHRQWRERKACFGQMVQLDGSDHDWLEGRGPKLVLMAYIDDATGNVYARFYEYEGTLPAFCSFKRYVAQYGIPISVYLDKHSTYKSPRQLSIAEELQGLRQGQSQFERAMKELGVLVIHAHSPQAKGRVERLFETLQDRLIKEMRLRGISTLAQANRFLEEYLPGFNQRFRVVAAQPADLHRPIPAGLDLDQILCIKTQRTVRNDATIAHDTKLYQILQPVRNKEVIVQERIDGSMRITQNGVPLKYKPITTRPKQEPASPTRSSAKPRKVYVPHMDHPWRQYKNKSQV